MGIISVIVFASVGMWFLGFFVFIFPVVAIVLGALSLKSSGRNKAVIGIILGVVSLIYYTITAASF